MRVIDKNNPERVLNAIQYYGEFIAGFNWKFFAIAYAIAIIPLYLIECKGENVSPHIALLVIVSCVLLVCHAIPLMYFRKKLLSGQ